MTNWLLRRWILITAAIALAAYVIVQAIPLSDAPIHADAYSYYVYLPSWFLAWHAPDLRHLLGPVRGAVPALQMSRTWSARVVALAAALAGLGWFLHDPPWAEGTTIGLRERESDASGTPFRWTNGHDALYVPRQASTLTLRLRAHDKAVEGGRSVTVRVSVDDQSVAALELTAPARWVEQMITIPPRATSRRSRRVDLRINRTVADFNLGVQLGDVSWRE